MKILLAIDDSAFTQKNIDYIGDLAKKLGAEVILLHAVAFPSITTADLATSIDFPRFEKYGEELLQKYKEVMEAKGLKVSTVLKSGFGSPANMIIEEIKKGEIDLLALGARGKSTFTNVLMGSVADGVAHNAPCSVLIIR